MADSVRISQLELIDRLTIDDILIVNNENVNTNSIKFSNLMNSVQEYPALNFQGSVVFSGPVSLPSTTVLDKSLTDLTDVTLVNTQATQILAYNGVTWTNTDLAGLSLDVTLNEIVDVILTDPAAGDHLVYNGSAWVNTPGGSSIGYTDLSVVTGSATSGGGLTYNNVTGVFTFQPDSNAGYATQVELTTLSAAVNERITAITGVPTGQVNLGTFTGSTISDDTNIKVALQELETALESGGADLTDVYGLFGVAEGDTDLGTFTNNPSYPNSITQISDNASVKVALQDLNDAIIENNQITILNISDTYALAGVPSGERDLGTFTGSTITDNSSIKTALQELETAVESAGGGGFSGSYNDLTDVPAFGTVATSNSYTDLDNLPTLGTAAAVDTTAFTSAADGTANSNAVDNLIAGLVAIGNDVSIADVDGLKAALAALVRDNT